MMNRWLALVRRINEGYWGSQEIENEYFNGSVDIFENPSRIELQKIQHEHGFLRGFFDGLQDDVYVWNGGALHSDVEVPGECWLTITVGGVLVQVDGESVANWFPGRDDYDITDVEEFVKRSRRMKPILLNRVLRVESR